MSKHFFDKFSLTKRIFFLTVLVCFFVFLGTDIFIGKAVEDSFRRELEAKLEQQAIEGRARLDRYIKSHYQLAKIIVSQQSFHEHLAERLRSGLGHEETIYKRPPAWLPKKSILRSVSQASYYILYDSNGNILEFYQSGVEPLPPELRSPELSLLRASQNENFVSSIAGNPCIISGESVNAFDQSFTLLLATPIDDVLLMRLLPSYFSDQIVVLSTGLKPYVVASSNTALVPKGVSISSLHPEFLIFGDKVYNYELSDLLITYSHLMPMLRIQQLARPIIRKQRLQYLLMGLTLVFSFTLIMLWMTRRIHGLTEKVVRFSQASLGLEPQAQGVGDEISILDNEFRFLTEEVIASTRKHASLLGSVLRAIPTPIFYMDVNGKYLGCNDAFADIVKFPKEEILGNDVFHILPKDQANVFHHDDKAVLKAGGPSSVQTAFTSKGGGTHDVFIHRASFEKGDGTVAGLVGAITDVSEITKVRDQLISAHALLESLIDSIPDLISYKNSQGVYLGCNKSFTEFAGRSEEEIIGHTDLDLFPEDLGRFFREKDKKMMDSGKAKRNEEWVDFPDGRKVLLDTLKTPFYGPDGGIKGLIGISRDITEKFLANEKIKAEYARFQNVLDSFDALIYVADMETYELLFINKFGKDIWGNVSGKICWQTLQSGQNGPCSFCTNSKLLSPEGKPTGVCVWEFQNTVSGDWFECRDQAIPWHDGRYVRLEIATKINERKKAEELQGRLRQAQKMEAIGTLAGGIAHDFNNILTPIIGYSELVLNSVSESDSIAGSIREIQKAAERAKHLVKQILMFSRKDEQIRQPLSPHLVIKETLKLLRSSLPTTIEIRENIPPNCGMILGDPTQLQQIVMNLCTNAYHAMRKKGGVLGVTLKRVEVPSDDQEVVAQHMSAGTYIEIEVSDTGTGIEKQILEKIFEPYFTTKEKGEGTGLGLATVHGIVKSYDGHITVSSELNKGTTFHIYLPLVEVMEKGEARDAEKGPLPGGNERLLLVDDEKTITNMLKDMLGRLGYDVTTFNQSEMALRAFEERPQEFDLVITDMTMPYLTGVDLSLSMKKIRPELPILLCTGFSEFINKEVAQEMGIREFLMKPVSVIDLAYAVRRALEKK